jgi:DNA-binding NtrC family response regulator
MLKDLGVAKTSTVLVVSPTADDLVVLRTILEHPACTDFGMVCSSAVIGASTVASAVHGLQQTPTAVVLCDSEVRAGSWTELLEHISTLPDPPYLILTSRLADERLWIKALNLGAYDVLAKPFEASEVLRIVTRACGHWKDRDERRASGTANKRVAAATAHAHRT